MDSTVTASDDCLVRAARGGDREAFAGLVHRYRDAVFGAALHYVGERHQAEDLAQDAFVLAYVRLGELREPARFGSWLFAITRSLCGQWARAERRRPAPASDEGAVEGLERQAATRDLVRRALEALSPENSLALTLLYIDGYSYEEISSFLGVPTSTLKGRIERGRAKLREEMVAMLREDLDGQKPVDSMAEAVIDRISAADLWALPREERDSRIGPGPYLLDGEPATGITRGKGGGSLLIATPQLVAAGDAPYAVYQSLADDNRYYVFGAVRLALEGEAVADGRYRTVMGLAPPSGPRPAPETAGSPPPRRPWRAEHLGSAVEFGRERAASLDEMPQFVAEDLWAAGAREAVARLGGCPYACFDGEPCVNVSHGRLRASTIIREADGATWALLRLVSGPERYYVFGRASVPACDAVLADEAVDLTVTMAPAVPDRPVPMQCEIRVEDLENPSGPVLRELHGSIRLLLLGGPSDAMLLGGEPGCYCWTRGGEVMIRNLGDGVLHVHQWLWPEPVCFIFGEAEVTPPGIRVKDAAVRLVAVDEG